MSGDNMITLNLKRIHLIILIIVGLATISAPAVSAFITIADHGKEIGKLDNRVSTLEKSEVENNKLLMEIKFNLKKHMETAGESYIDLDSNVK